MAAALMKRDWLEFTSSLMKSPKDQWPGLRLVGSWRTIGLDIHDETKDQR